MSDSKMTLEEYRRSCEGSIQEVSMNMTFAQTHEARIRAVQKAIDCACDELQKSKSKKQNLGEDQLTLEIVAMLKFAGFQASHDGYTNGHCDIVVIGKDLFLWLAEAKKHRSYDWLEKGLQQLSERYSTGAIGQDCGDILIYCFGSDAKSVLDKWRSELATRHPNIVITDTPNENLLEFSSIHKHSASGLDFHVRHKAIALHWKPKDK